MKRRATDFRYDPNPSPRLGGARGQTYSTTISEKMFESTQNMSVEITGTAALGCLFLGDHWGEIIKNHANDNMQEPGLPPTLALATGWLSAKLLPPGYLTAVHSGGEGGRGGGGCSRSPLAPAE